MRTLGLCMGVLAAVAAAALAGPVASAQFDRPQTSSDGCPWLQHTRRPGCVFYVASTPPAPGGAGGGGAPLDPTGMMVQGVMNNNLDQFATGFGLLGFQSILGSLFGESSGPSAEEIAAERARRELEERRRMEELRRARVARAARYRAELDRSEAEMSERLAGVFDLPTPRSTSFFGIPGGADAPEEDLRDGPNTDPMVVDLRPDHLIRRGFGFGPRTPSGPVYSSDVVVLTSDPVGVNPEFIGASELRAAETAAWARDHSPSGWPARGSDPRQGSWRDVAKERLAEEAKARAAAEFERALREGAQKLGVPNPGRIRDIGGAIDDYARGAVGSLGRALDDPGGWQEGEDARVRRLREQVRGFLYDELKERIPLVAAVDEGIKNYEGRKLQIDQTYRWAEWLKGRSEGLLTGAWDRASAWAAGAGPSLEGPRPPRADAPPNRPPAAPREEVAERTLPVQDPGARILELAAKYVEDGSGYNEAFTGSGTPREILWKGERVLPKNEGGTYCSGYTFSVVMDAAERHPAFKAKTLQEMKEFQQNWYGNLTKAQGARLTKEEAQEVVEKQAAAALRLQGVGREVTDPRAGDFVQFWRTPKGERKQSGHSAVFLGWEKNAEGEVVGLRYRSSQGKTSGIGEATEYFGDTPGVKGSVRPDRVYFGRLNEAP